MKKIGIATFIVGIALILGAQPTAAVDSTAEPTVELRWALGAIDANSDSPNAVRKDTELATGSRLKFLVEPLAPGSVYLLLLDSDDDIHVLLSETTGDDAAATYVPSGGQWFELDGAAGQETFFLLASTEPLADLESLLARLDSADPAARKTLGKEIVEEIRNVHRANRNFARPVEKPVMIGGQTRGVVEANAIDRLAMEISAEHFYGKTITIDHRP